MAKPEVRQTISNSEKIGASTGKTAYFVKVNYKIRLIYKDSWEEYKLNKKKYKDQNDNKNGVLCYRKIIIWLEDKERNKNYLDFVWTDINGYLNHTMKINGFKTDIKSDFIEINFNKKYSSITQDKIPLNSNHKFGIMVMPAHDKDANSNDILNNFCTKNLLDIQKQYSKRFLYKFKNNHEIKVHCTLSEWRYRIENKIANLRKAIKKESEELNTYIERCKKDHIQMLILIEKLSFILKCTKEYHLSKNEYDISHLQGMEEHGGNSEEFDSIVRRLQCDLENDLFEENQIEDKKVRRWRADEYNKCIRKLKKIETSKNLNSNDYYYEKSKLIEEIKRISNTLSKNEKEKRYKKFKDELIDKIDGFINNYRKCLDEFILNNEDAKNLKSNLDKAKEDTYQKAVELWKLLCKKELKEELELYINVHYEKSNKNNNGHILQTKSQMDTEGPYTIQENFWFHIFASITESYKELSKTSIKQDVYEKHISPSKIVSDKNILTNSINNIVNMKLSFLSQAAFHTLKNISKPYEFYYAQEYLYSNDKGEKERWIDNLNMIFQKIDKLFRIEKESIKILNCIKQGREIKSITDSKKYVFLKLFYTIVSIAEKSEKYDDIDIKAKTVLSSTNTSLEVFNSISGLMGKEEVILNLKKINLPLKNIISSLSMILDVMSANESFNDHDNINGSLSIASALCGFLSFFEVCNPYVSAGSILIFLARQIEEMKKQPIEKDIELLIKNFEPQWKKIDGKYFKELKKEFDELLKVIKRGKNDLPDYCWALSEDAVMPLNEKKVPIETIAKWTLLTKASVEKKINHFYKYSK